MTSRYTHQNVSVVVCTYSTDRLGYVLDCVESLMRQTFLPYEVILAVDRDQPLVNFYVSQVPSSVKLVVSDGHGLSIARNAGAKNSEGEIVAFIDDDAVAASDWLENLVKGYDDRTVVSVGGSVEPIWESSRPTWFPEELDWIVGCSYDGLPEKKTTIRNPIGCNMSFKREVFSKIGFFEKTVGRKAANLVSGEETDLSIRILQELPESRIVYVPSARVLHRVPRKRSRFTYVIKRSFYEGFSIALITNHVKSKRHVMAVESRYLNYLLRVSIPMRLKGVYRRENIQQLLVLLLSMFSVMVGYSTGRLKK